jgi:hypothetical protein
MASSSASADEGDRSRRRQIILGPEQFEVIFQVTHQLPNYQEERLISEGMSPHGLDLLVELLGFLRGPAESSSRVRIWVAEVSDVDPLATIALEAGSESLEGEWVAVGRLPEAVAVVWQPLLRFVVSSMGERELFLRTGYRADEIDAAIDALVVRGKSE